jgi:hypothetical protein
LCGKEQTWYRTFLSHFSPNTAHALTPDMACVYTSASSLREVS